MKSDTSTLLSIVRKLLFTFSIVFAGSITACELHAGMNEMGFGFQHPLMQQHLMPQRDAMIDLRIDRKREVNKNEEVAVPLRYVVPSNYEKISVEVTTSSGLILVSDDQFRINKAIGKHNISFMALETGEHEMLLEIYALKNNIPVTYIRKMKVVVS